MKLHKLILVNWYLLNPQEIEIRGNTAILGPNGSGKSAFIDAFQTILFGGSQSYTKYNAGSSEKKSHRNILSYCLGTYRPAGEEDGELFRERDECESYLAMVCKKGDTFINFFIGIEARASDNYLNVSVRAIHRGDRALTLADFVTFKEDSYQTRDIATIINTLSFRGLDFTSYDTAKAYIEVMVSELGPSQLNQVIEYEKLASALSRSIGLREIDGDVSRFVEQFILPAENISVSSMVNAKRRYEELSEEIEKATNKINKLKPIYDGFYNADKAYCRHIAYSWLGYEISANQLSDEIASLSESFMEAVNGVRTAKRDLREIEVELQNEQEKRSKVKAKIDRDDVQAQITQLSKEKRDTENHLVGVNSSKNKLYTEIVDVISMPVTYLSGLDGLSLLQDISRCIERDNNLMEASEIDAFLEKLPLWIEGTLIPHKKMVSGAAYSDKRQAEDKQDELVKQIAKAKEHGEVLSPSVEHVIEVLARYNIEAIPVCRVATVSDPSWQPAIEAYLKGNREALIVPPESNEEAFAVYRQLKVSKVNLYNVRIIKTSLNDKWLNQFEANTAATLIESDNEYALGFLHHLLGHVKLVATEKELKSSRAAITKDGMTANSSSVSRNQLPSHLKMVMDQSANIAFWEQEVVKLQQIITDNGLILDDMGLIDTKLLSYASRIKEKGGWVGFSAFNEEMDKLREQLANIDKQLSGLNTDHIKAWKKELSSIDDTLLSLNATNNTLNQAMGTNRQLKDSTKAIIRKKQYEELPSIEKSRKEVQKNPLFSMQYAAELQEKMDVDEGDPEFLVTVSNRATNAKNQADNTLTKATLDLRAYINYVEDFIENNEELNVELLGAGQMAERVKNQIDAIEQYDLHTKQAAMEKASEDINQAFRSDMVQQLKDKFQKMHMHFSNLNAALKQRHFHGEMYQYKRFPIPEYEDLIKFIEKTDDTSFAGYDDLFNEMPDSIMKQIDLLLTDTSSANERRNSINDYRRYYRYEVEVTNTTTNSKHHLTKLLLTGSGGEKQSPFYVTVASSLASVWGTLKRPGESFGIALLDEAFNKMDENNLANAISFMNEIGLQLMVAAPSEKESVFKPAMDTIIYISREDRAVEVDIEYINEKGKSVLWQDNPILNRHTHEEGATVDE